SIAIEVDAVRIAGEKVAPDGGAQDSIVIDFEALNVWERGRASRIGPDEIAHDLIVGCAEASHFNSITQGAESGTRMTGDYIARGRRGAPDRIVGRAIDKDA